MTAKPSQHGNDDSEVLKFKDFQGPLTSNSNTLKAAFHFQGLSRSWKNGKKISRTFKNFQGRVATLFSSTCPVFKALNLGAQIKYCQRLSRMRGNPVYYHSITHTQARGNKTERFCSTSQPVWRQLRFTASAVCVVLRN